MFLKSYWSPSPGFMVANTAGGRSGVDANSVLASIHTFDVDAGCDSTTWQPCSDFALSNLKTYIDSFRYIYSINFGVPANAAVATGRYSEDIYQGGNVSPVHHSLSSLTIFSSHGISRHSRLQSSSMTPSLSGRARASLQSPPPPSVSFSSLIPH